jgi:mRNA interferase MazF
VREAPRKGDIIRLNFDPRAGHEQRGFRPAVVVSNSTYNAHSSMVIVCPITSSLGAWPFKVPLPDELAVKGAVLVDQITAIDWRARSARRAGSCPPDVIEQIDAKLEVLFKGRTSGAG